MTQPVARSVLMFHGIGQSAKAMEPDEELYWIDWPLFDAILDHCATLPAQADRFTFDDGNASDLEAARRMRARGIGGSFFVLVGRIGQPGYLTRDDLHELLDLGMVVGLHGRDHRDWRKVDDRTLHSEIDLARSELADLCGRRIDTLAIPFGAYDRRIWTYLERTDLARIYTSDPGRSRPDARFVRRHSVKRDHALADVRAILEDAAPLHARLRRTVAPMVKRFR